ncbi:hypothetical protein LCGC14_2757440 [marine sediment metagenome]|uniref:Uncharacterized protein n=1 Tax=marine sediment metagenome TaxID=412755 RepID=A0A0F8Z021_9ZZZZ
MTTPNVVELIEKLWETRVSGGKNSGGAFVNINNLKQLRELAKTAVLIPYGECKGKAYGEDSDSPGTIVFFPDKQQTLEEAAREITSHCGHTGDDDIHVHVDKDLYDNLKAALENETNSS